MIEKIKELWTKYEEIIVYLIVGGLTTVVSWSAKFLANFLLFDNTLYPTAMQNVILSFINWAAGVAFAYPTNRKDAYYSVRNSLRDVMPSARFEHFTYKPGDILSAELWLLNDSPDQVSDTISAYITIDGERKHLLDWKIDISEPNTNIKGHKVEFKIPETDTQLITFTLEAESGNSEYTLLLRNDPPAPRIPNALNF